MAAPEPLLTKTTVDHFAAPTANQPPLTMLDNPPAKTVEAALANAQAQVAATARKG